MARLKFTGFEEGKLYKDSDSGRSNYYYKILNGILYFESLDGRSGGVVGFNDWDVEDLLETIFEEVKPVVALTENQRKILEGRLLEGYEWVTRDRNEDLYCYTELPSKLNITWTPNEGKGSSLLGEFDFLSWKDEEPTNIRELLEHKED